MRKDKYEGPERFGFDEQASGNWQEDPDVVDNFGESEIVPDESWSDDDLIDYLKGQVDGITLLQRRTAVKVWLAGKAAYILRDRMKKDRRWCRFQQENDLPRATVWEAIKLYELAPALDLVKGLGLDEAKREFGIRADAMPEDGDDTVDPASAESTADSDEETETPLDEAHAGTSIELALDEDEEESEEATSDFPSNGVAGTAVSITKVDWDATLRFVQQTGGWERASLVLQEVRRMQNDLD